jgi:hypothetical protein
VVHAAVDGQLTVPWPQNTLNAFELDAEGALHDGEVLFLVGVEVGGRRRETAQPWVIRVDDDLEVELTGLVCVGFWQNASHHGPTEAMIQLVAGQFIKKVFK